MSSGTALHPERYDSRGEPPLLLRALALHAYAGHGYSAAFPIWFQRALFAALTTLRASQRIPPRRAAALAARSPPHDTHAVMMCLGLARNDTAATRRETADAIQDRRAAGFVWPHASAHDEKPRSGLERGFSFGSRCAQLAS